MCFIMQTQVFFKMETIGISLLWHTHTYTHECSGKVRCRREYDVCLEVTLFQLRAVQTHIVMLVCAYVCVRVCVVGVLVTVITSPLHCNSFMRRLIKCVIMITLLLPEGFIGWSVVPVRRVDVDVHTALLTKPGLTVRLSKVDRFWELGLYFWGASPSTLHFKLFYLAPVLRNMLRLQLLSAIVLFLQDTSDTERLRRQMCVAASGRGAAHPHFRCHPSLLVRQWVYDTHTHRGKESRYFGMFPKFVSRLKDLSAAHWRHPVAKKLYSFTKVWSPGFMTRRATFVILHSLKFNRSHKTCLNMNICSAKDFIRSYNMWT